MLRPTKRAEQYFLNRVDNFILWAEADLREEDVMWTVGWDSAD